MEQPKDRPYVGFGVFVFNSNGEVLLLRRLKEGHGKGDWCLPGGHWEPHIFAGSDGRGETLLEAVRRELLEEVNLTCDQITKFDFQEIYFPAIDRWYVTLFIVADGVKGIADNMENGRDGKPAKHDAMSWFRMDNLPTNLFDHLRLVIDRNPNQLPNLPQR